MTDQAIATTRAKYAPMFTLVNPVRGGTVHSDSRVLVRQACYLSSLSRCCCPGWLTNPTFCPPLSAAESPSLSQI